MPTQDAQSHLFELRGVCVRKGVQTILDSITLVVAPGEAVAILGANGSGKSTLLRCCAGMESISAGTIHRGGAIVDRGQESADLASGARIGMVFQQHQLVRAYCVLTNVVHGRLGMPEGWRCCWHVMAPDWVRCKAMESLHQVGMADKALRRVGDLSGGEAQRVAIARALIRDPDLLLADEPTASLDPLAKRDVLSHLTRLARGANVAVVAAIHDEQLALESMDRIVGLQGGRIAFDAPAGSVSADQIRDLYTAPMGASTC